jgi:2'-5' RNA ligase
MHDPDTNLCFIALVPGKELRERVLRIKERMQRDFNAGHALKSPAHVTLQMPFRRKIADESAIVAALDRFAAGEAPFDVHLEGFGCFAPRVIFIRLVNPKHVIELHRRLNAVLLEGLGFAGSEIMKSVQPHMTIATRDLTKQAFAEAWPEYEDAEFTGSFHVGSLFLLKHNGSYWDIFREFQFRADG